MKMRTSFVSNSSSSSFVISKDYLTDLQIERIKNHIQFDHDNNLGHGIEYDKWALDEWIIDENVLNIYGRTSMDNFNMYAFLKNIGVDLDKVEWDR